MNHEFLEHCVVPLSTHTHTHTHTHTRGRVCVRVRVRIRIRICVRVCVHARIHIRGRARARARGNGRVRIRVRFLFLEFVIVLYFVRSFSHVFLSFFFPCFCLSVYLSPYLVMSKWQCQLKAKLLVNCSGIMILTTW